MKTIYYQIVRKVHNLRIGALRSALIHILFPADPADFLYLPSKQFLSLLCSKNG